jgi:Ca2+-binding RTX toxin-like protein
MYLSERYRNLISEWSRKLHVFEAFNGQYFFNLPEKKSQTDGANWGLAISAGSGGGGSSGGDGGAGNDLLIGSTGWNWIYENGSYRVERNTTPSISANGNDTYLFGGGDGQDTVIDGDYTAGNSDTLRFKEWVAPTDVKLIRSGEDLVLACKGRRWRDGEAANKAWRIAA